MKKTITASFDVPDNGHIIRINLSDTNGIVVDEILRIGFDWYTITNVDQLGVTVIKRKTTIPVGMECLIE